MSKRTEETPPDMGQDTGLSGIYDAREADLDAREAALAAREAALAPREREAHITTRSRVTDDTRRFERQSMDYYAPPNQLRTPEDPEYHFRWIAEHVNGQQMPRNVQMRLQEGYVRVRMDELPEDFMVDEDLKGDGYARTSGLILMRLPIERKRLRDAYYAKKSRERANSVDELQGIAGRNAVREDRGTRTLTGAEAGRALANMSQS
jgi:hypothetical protein